MFRSSPRFWSGALAVSLIVVFVFTQHFVGVAGVVVGVILGFIIGRR